MKIINRVFVMLSQNLNVLTGGAPDELLCSRMWCKKQEGLKSGKIGVAILNTIFFYEPNHCKDSYDAEVEGRHLSAALYALRNPKKETVA